MSYIITQNRSIVHGLIAVGLSIVLTTMLSFKRLQSAQQLMLYTNNFTKELTAEISCSDFSDIGVRLPNSDQLRNYDIIQLNLYCELKGHSGKLIHVLYKEIQPESKEFKVKYANKQHIDLFLARTADNSYTTDFIKTSTAMSGDAKHQFCCCTDSYHKYRVELMGFLKTGKKIVRYDSYGSLYEVDEYDTGTIIGKTISFNVK